MHCHYIKHKGIKILIPGCMGTAAMGIENCTCKRNISLKQFERNEYNKAVNELINNIKELECEINRLKKQYENI